MHILKIILGRLLHLANRDVNFYCKEQFYAIKKNILTKYGTKIGEDIQHIRKECYSCNSTGTFRCDWKYAEPCFRCDGTGIYEEYWTRLDKYKLGNYEFHNPTKRQGVYNPLFEGIALPVITGYIHHKAPKHRMGAEAMYWLFLIYDFKHFKKMFGVFGYSGNIRSPMVLFASIAYKIRNEWKFDIYTKNKGWFWKRKEPDLEAADNNYSNDLPF